jgi:hypothetical protein
MSDDHKLPIENSITYIYKHGLIIIRIISVLSSLIWVNNNNGFKNEA